MMKTNKKCQLKGDQGSTSEIVLAFIKEEDSDEISPCSNSQDIVKSKKVQNKSLGTARSIPSPTPMVPNPIQLNSDFVLRDFSRTCQKLSSARNSVNSHHFDAISSKWALRSGSFRVVLLVDKMEVTAGFTGGKKSRKHLTTEELDALGIDYENRKLSIGDFLWIAKGPNDQELVLPYIVERKRMDDLRSSIMDGRYAEQKHRIHQCDGPGLLQANCS